MELRIKETGTLEELIIMDRNANVEVTQDLTAGDTEITYNRETGEYEVSNESYKWWTEEIKAYHEALDLRDKVAEILDTSIIDVDALLADHFGLYYELGEGNSRYLATLNSLKDGTTQVTYDEYGRVEKIVVE